MSIARKASILTLLVILCACERDTSFDGHMANARQFISSSEYDLAVSELKSALLKDRQSGEARWLLGTVYFNTGATPSAEKEFQKALQFGWSPNDVVPPLAESLLAQHKYTSLHALAETGLESHQLARLLAAKALAANALGERHNAITLVNSALDLAPESTAALFAKALVLAGERDFSAAEIVLEEVISEEPGNGSAWSLMGDIQVGLNKPEEALIAYNNAIARIKSDYATLLKRALLNLRSGHYRSAQTDTTQLLHINPQQSGANYVQGLIHFQSGRYDEAITPLWLGIRDFKQYPLALFFLSCAELRLGNFDQASGLASQYQELVPDSIRGRKLLSFIRLSEGRYEEVGTLLDPVLQANSDDPGALKLLSNAALRDNRANEGFELLSRLAAQGTDPAIAQVRLGPGQLLEGDGDDAAQYLETTLQLGPDFQQAKILDVMRALHRQEYQAAIVAAGSYRALNPDSTIPLNLMGRVYLSANQPDKARQLFENALKLNSGDPAANHNLAQMAMSGEDLLAARKYYTTILEHNRENLRALIQLALLDEQEGKGDSFVRHLERATWAHEGALEPRLLLGRYYLSNGNPQRVALQFNDLEEVQQKSLHVIQLKALAKLAREEKAEEERQTLAAAMTAAKQAIQKPAGLDLKTWGHRLIVRLVRRLAPVYGLDPNMVLAVIKAESNFNPGARSPANAVGLMQLIPATAARFAVRDRTNPVQNIKGGMAYLRWLLAFFEGDLPLALAGYNAGEGAVVKYLGVPPYPETQNYVRKILKTYGHNTHPPIESVVKPTRSMPAIRAKQAGRS